MKKKLILGMLTILTATLVFSDAEANTESTSLGNCKAPYTNTCMIIHAGFFVKSIKGVLTINL